MQQHYLISFIGTGKYETTTYRYDGQACLTKFFYLAAEQFLSPDHILLAMTKEARDKYEADLDLSGACTIIDIPTGGTEQDIWQSFDTISRAVPDGCQLSLDITHGFRFQPLMSMASLLYLQAVKDVEINAVLYGHWKGHGYNNEVTDVVNLTPFMTLVEWSYGMRSLTRFGQFAPLGAVIKESNKSIYANTTGHKPKSLGNLASQLTYLGQSIEVNELLEVGRLTTKIDTLLSSISDDIADIPASMPLKQILVHLNAKISDLKPRDNSRRGDQPTMIRHLLTSGQYQQAITVSREAVILHFHSYLALQGQESLSIDTAEAVMKDWLQAISISDAIVLKHFKDIISRLLDLRNSVNHAFVGRQQSKLGKLLSNIEAACNDIARWLDEPEPLVLESYGRFFKSAIG